MALSGRGALLGWFDCDPRDARDLSEWLAREHFPERLGVPGFLRGRRFRSPDGHPEFCVLYEVESVETLSSKPYLERLNDPTPLTRAMAPRIVGQKRTACVITASVGELDGGWIATLDLQAEPASADRLRERLASDMLPELLARPGIYAGHLLEAEEGISSITTVEKALRGVPDEITSWTVLVEGPDDRVVRHATEEVLSPETLLGAGAAAAASPCVFALEFALGVRRP